MKAFMHLDSRIACRYSSFLVQTRTDRVNQHAIERETQWRRMMRTKNPQSLVAGAALAAFLSAAIGVVAQSTPSRSLLALSKRNHTLAIVDPNTLQVIARAPV